MGIKFQFLLHNPLNLNRIVAVNSGYHEHKPNAMQFSQLWSFYDLTQQPTALPITLVFEFTAWHSTAFILIRLNTASLMRTASPRHDEPLRRIKHSCCLLLYNKGCYSTFTFLFISSPWNLFLLVPSIKATRHILLRIFKRLHPAGNTVSMSTHRRVERLHFRDS